MLTLDRNSKGVPDVVDARAELWQRMLLGVLVLGGCAVGPDFKKPVVPVAKDWLSKNDPRISTQKAAEAGWWKGFGDPALDRLVDLAYRQNLPLQIAGLRIVQARAELGVLTGRQFPQLQVATAGATATGLTRQETRFSGLDRNHLTYEVGFDAAWELDFWGKYRRGVEAGSANLLATVADYHSSLVSLTAEVARIYTVIRTFEVLIQQGQENARLQEEGLRLADARFRNGATSELDVTQATTLLEGTRASIPDLEIGLHQARNALSTLLGQSTGTVEALLAGPRDIPKAPAKVAVSVPTEMLRRRPDIRRAEMNAAAQSARIGVAKAELYPSFSLFGTIGLKGNTAGGEFFSGDALFYSAGPRIIWPFFNYGRLTNSVRVEDAKFQQLLVGYRDTVLRAVQEVEDALIGFLKSQEALAFAERSVAAAVKSQEIAVIQYREGATDYERVLDAQRALLERQNAMAQTRSNVTVNVIALYKALGGGWRSLDSQPIVPERMQEEMKERTDWGDMLSQPRKTETQQNPRAEKR